MSKDLSNKRLLWIDILRGLTIMLVVMWHVNLVDLSTGLNHPFCKDVSSLFTPFRIPLFMFISGGVLYIGRISRNWDCKKLYLDKAKRLLLPLMCFVVIYVAIKCLFIPFVKTPFQLSIAEFFRSFVYFQKGNPAAHLWFLALLFLLMLFYPVYKIVCRNNYLLNLMLVISLLLNIFFKGGFSPIFCLNYLPNYFIFFFCGIYCFRYQLFLYLEKPSATLICIAFYALSFYVGIELITQLCGVAMMVSIGINISKYIPGLFSSFRGYSYQIYLMSMMFQGIVELILWKKLFYNESLFYFFYILNVLAGIYLPVLVAKWVEKCNYSYVRICFGLK